MGLLSFLNKKKKAVPELTQPEYNPENYRVIKPESHFLLISCDSEVRDRLLGLSDEPAFTAERWYQALYAVCSRSSHFVSVSHDATRFNWLTKPVAFQSSTGIFLFGIDEYEDGDQWFMHTEEKGWRISTHLITDSPKEMCDEIALAIEEVLGIKLFWELPERALLSLELHADDTQG